MLMFPSPSTTGSDSMQEYVTLGVESSENPNDPMGLFQMMQL